MKFCSNCGTQLEDSMKFCSACGTQRPQINPQPQQAMPKYSFEQAQPVQQAPQYSYNQPYVATTQSAPVKTGFMGKIKKFVKEHVWAIPVAAVAAIFLIWLTVFFFRSVVGSGSLTMKGAVKNYLEAYEDMDGRKIVNATMSNSMLKAVKKSEDLTKKEIIEEFDSMFDYYSDDYEIKYRKIKITDKEKYDRDEVKEVKNQIKDSTGVRVSIQKIYNVEVSYEVWNNYSEQWVDGSSTFVAYKSSGNWYILYEMP